MLGLAEPRNLICVAKLPLTAVFEWTELRLRMLALSAILNPLPTMSASNRAIDTFIKSRITVLPIVKNAHAAFISIPIEMNAMI